MNLLVQHPNLANSLQKVCEKCAIKTYKIINIQGNAKGEGYLSQILSVKIEDLKSGKIEDFIIKSAFSDDKIRTIAPIQRAFLNEILFYTKVCTNLQALEADFHLPQREFAPKCYHVVNENLKEMLCLENLKAKNFEVFSRFKIVDHEHLSFIFKTYGIFHGYMFTWRYYNSKDFAEFPEILAFLDLMGDHEHSFGSFMKTSAQRIANYITDPILLAKFQHKYVDNLQDSFKNIVNAKPKSSIILHGDCWSNNMMFKYENDKIVDMRLLDFQMNFIGSPACDLSYVLYSGGTKEHFDNLDTYLQIYHDSLSMTLKEFECNPDEVYSLNDLKNDWKEFAKFGMMLSFVIIRGKCTPEENAKDFVDVIQSTDHSEPHFDEKQYKKRILEIIQHMEEIGGF